MALHTNIRQMPPSHALSESPERIGLYVTLVQLAVQADLAPRLTGLGLTSPSRLTALLHIRAHPGCSQSELADFTGLSRVSAATMVDQLETAGFVERRPGPNGRTNALLLTAAGEEAIGRANQQTAINEERLFGTLSGTERKTMLRLLGKVIAQAERARSQKDVATE